MSPGVKDQSQATDGSREARKRQATYVTQKGKVQGQGHEQVIGIWASARADHNPGEHLGGREISAPPLILDLLGQAS